MHIDYLSPFWQCQVIIVLTVVKIKRFTSQWQDPNLVVNGHQDWEHDVGCTKAKKKKKMQRFYNIFAKNVEEIAIHYNARLTCFKADYKSFCHIWKLGAQQHGGLELLTPNPNSKNTQEPTLLVTQPRASPSTKTLLQPMPQYLSHWTGRTVENLVGK